MEMMDYERIVITELWKSIQLKLSSYKIKRIIQAAEAGAMVVVISNLVSDAQEIAHKLTGMTDVIVDLFHSRYRFVDRQTHEENIKKIYGKEGDRSGRILVATQVVEQSLDLDFDWMITQLCPVDLLFQRLGRLHRHERHRPQGFESPSFAVIVPEKDSLIYGDSKYVYQNHRAMWRTSKILEENDVLSFPDAYRKWIEKVYLA